MIILLDETPCIETEPEYAIRSRTRAPLIRCIMLRAIVLNSIAVTVPCPPEPRAPSLRKRLSFIANCNK